MAINLSPFQNRKNRRKQNLDSLLEEKIVKETLRQRLGVFLKKRYKAIAVVVWLLFSFFYHIYYYNRLVVTSQDVSNMKSQIESALQLRQNLVPALTTVVYQFIQHENNIFLRALESRKDSLSPYDGRLKNLETLKGLNGKNFPEGTLSKLIALAENYPSLVSSESYKLLISQIAEVENQIFKQRVEYNNVVNDYNTLLSLFPVNIIGLTSGFQKAAYFTWEASKAEWSFTYIQEKGEIPVSMQPAAKRKSEEKEEK